MSEPSSTQSRLTCLPCGPVCTVTRVAPSICLANSLTSAIDLAMRTPPLSPAEASLNLPLPRPPAWIWLFTTQIGPGSVFAATSESEARRTGTPFEIGTPNSCNSALAWYSWIFILDVPRTLVRQIGNSDQFCSSHTIYHRNCKSGISSHRCCLIPKSAPHCANFERWRAGNRLARLSGGGWGSAPAEPG